MQTLEIISTPFIILALGFVFDLILNEGSGTRSLLYPPTQPSTSELIKDTLSELDGLYDDLTYDNDEDEITAIKSKISAREKVLEVLLKENK